MNENEKYAPTGKTMRRIADTVRFVETGGQLPRGGLKKRHRLIPHEEGVLLDDLLGTDDPNVPTTARFQIKSPHRTGNGWSDDVDPSIVTVLNRTPTDFFTGDVGLAVEVHTDKWLFYASSTGGTIRDGIVRTVLGCGWYQIELGTFVGSPDDIGSVSGSAGCSPCSNIVGEGTSGCAIEISPPASKVIGTGTIVTAYDPFSDKVLLVVGTDCVVAKTIGSTTGSASGSAQSSGTESSVWKVVNGYHEHVVKYEEDGSCCGADGQWVTTRKKPTILIGTDCPWIDCTPCPSASGSA